jgi:PA domain
VSGKIVLVRRGFCTFAVKQQSAAVAGAIGAII